MHRAFHGLGRRRLLLAAGTSFCIGGRPAAFSPRCKKANKDTRPAASTYGVGAKTTTPSPRPARPARLRGFTLIELLIAIAIMAAMTVVSWRGIDGMARAREQAHTRSDAALLAQAALTQWSADLDAIELVAGTTPLDWDGRVLRITRRSSDAREQGLRVVAWTVRGRGGQGWWARWQSAPLRTSLQWRQAWEQAATGAADANSAFGRQETVLMPVSDWQLLYMRDNAWTHPQSSDSAAAGSDSHAGSPDNPTTTVLPDGVRLRLILPAPGALAGTLTLDWANPLLRGNKS